MPRLVFALALSAACAPSAPPTSEPAPPVERAAHEPAAPSEEEAPEPDTPSVADADPAPDASSPADAPVQEPEPTTTPEPATEPEPEASAEASTEPAPEATPEPEPSTEPAAEPEPDASAEAAEPEPTPIRYTLTPGASVLSVLVRYDRDALVNGHDHVLVASSFSGTVSWTPGDPSACAVDITVPARSLVVDPPGSRARAGLEGETSDKDKRKILDNALGRSQLDAERHPSLTFRATSCRARGDQVVVTGPLTIRGTPHTVSVPMRISADDQRFTARGSVTATHADFGFSPFSAALGAVRNDEVLTFGLDVQGRPLR